MADDLRKDMMSGTCTCGTTDQMHVISCPALPDFDDDPDPLHEIHECMCGDPRLGDGVVHRVHEPCQGKDV
jgi:hypothetical protein